MSDVHYPILLQSLLQYCFYIIASVPGLLSDIYQYPILLLARCVFPFLLLVFAYECTSSYTAVIRVSEIFVKSRPSTTDLSDWRRAKDNETPPHIELRWMCHTSRYYECLCMLHSL